MQFSKLLNLYNRIYQLIFLAASCRKFGNLDFFAETCQLLIAETNLKFEWRPLNFHPYLACFSVSSQEQTDICRGVTNHEIKLPRFYKMERGRGPIVLKKNQVATSNTNRSCRGEEDEAICKCLFLTVDAFWKLLLAHGTGLTSRRKGIK
jgi:hypothetical protein